MTIEQILIYAASPEMWPHCKGVRRWFDLPYG